ncbi:MAG: phosphoesterase [Burkholderiaceae bacterium]
MRTGPPKGVFPLGDLWLWPGFAVTRPAYSQLIVADVHLGKAASFRAQGVPVPDQVTEESLERLSGLIRVSRSSSLIVLGDLIHDRKALSGLLPIWERWREQHPRLELKLIVGNHDRKAGRSAIEKQLPGLQVHEEKLLDQGLLMAHEADDLIDVQTPVNAPDNAPDNAPVLGLCGHEHPVVLIPDALKAKHIRRPCFYLDHQQILHLPAFGSFTGGHLVSLAQCKRLFIDMVDAVKELSPLALDRGQRRYR